MAKKPWKKPVEHKVTSADLADVPELAEQGVKEGDVILATEDEISPVPSFTLRADSAFGIRCMMMVRDLAYATEHPDRVDINKLLREFDLYEEQNRG